MLTKKEIDDNRKKILDALRSTERKGIEDLLKWFEASNFFTSPASTMFHGNYEGGLALHSYEVYRLFEARAKEYRLNVPREAAIIAGICHDCCKIDYYVPNRLKSGNLSETKPYKVEDILPLGHGEKSVVLVRRHIQMTPQESVLIRWHMGHEDKAWEDYKEKVEEQFPEVVVFQHADKEVSLIKKI